MIAKIQPQFAFLILGFIFGLSFLLVNPPFQVPDENKHFLKAYQISTGQIKSIRENNRIGGYIPLAVNELARSFQTMKGDMYTKTTADSIWALQRLKLEKDVMVFVDFPSTAKYSFINYVPQSLSIALLRLATNKVLFLYYGSKILTLLFWLTCIYLAISIIPVHKWLFTALALLPMSLYVNGSMSGDIVTNASAFLLIGSVLRIAHRESPLTGKYLIVPTVLILILASTKIVYTPLLLLFFLIPRSSFPTRFHQIGVLSGLILLTAITALYWYGSMEELYLPYSKYNSAFRDGTNLHKGVDMTIQFQFLMENPGHLFTVLANSTGYTMRMVHESYIGTFGWLDTKLPLWLINSSYLVLFVVAIGENHKSTHLFFWRNKVLYALTFLVILGLMIITLFLTWTLIGADYVHIQGRYLIACAPLLLLLFGNSRWNFPSAPPVLVIGFSLLVLGVSYATIMDRFYTPAEFTITQISCNSERVENAHFGTNNPDIHLENGTTQTNERARSGMYAVKVNPQNKYSMTYRTKTVDYGDVIQAEVWIKGNDAGLVLQSGRDQELYEVESRKDSTDANGWSRIRINQTINFRSAGTETAIYIFNFGNETAYFDDLNIVIKKPK